MNAERRSKLQEISYLVIGKSDAGFVSLTAEQMKLLGLGDEAADYILIYQVKESLKTLSFQGSS